MPIWTAFFISVLLVVPFLDLLDQAGIRIVVVAGTVLLTIVFVPLMRREMHKNPERWWHNNE